MAGAATGWVKASAGPIKGTAVFVPPSVQQESGLTKEQILQQIEAGCGTIIPHIVAKPKGVAQKAVPPETPADGLAKELLVVQQADGQYGVRLGYKLGDLWVVDTPYGHSIVHAKSGKALLYVGSQGKPTAKSEAQAVEVAKGLLAQPGAGWDAELAEHLSAQAQKALTAVQTKGIKLNGKVAFAPPPPPAAPEPPPPPTFGDAPFTVEVKEVGSSSTYAYYKKFQVLRDGFVVHEGENWSAQGVLQQYLDTTPLKGHLPYSAIAGGIAGDAFTIAPPPYPLAGITNGGTSYYYGKVTDPTTGQEWQGDGSKIDGLAVVGTKSKWAIAHVGTGKILGYAKTKTKGIDLVKELQKTGVDWLKADGPVLSPEQQQAVDTAFGTLKNQEKQASGQGIPEAPAAVKQLCPKCKASNDLGASVCKKCNASLLPTPEGSLGTVVMLSEQEYVWRPNVGHQKVTKTYPVLVVGAGNKAAGGWPQSGGGIAGVGVKEDGTFLSFYPGADGALIPYQTYKTKHGALGSMANALGATDAVQLDKATLKAMLADPSTWSKKPGAPAPASPPPPAASVAPAAPAVPAAGDSIAAPAADASAAAPVVDASALGTGEPTAAGGVQQLIEMLPGVSEKQAKVPIQAEVFGHFALYEQGGTWTLGHVTSGYPIAMGFKKKEHALEGLKMAQAAKVNWGYTNKTELKADGSNFQAAAAIGQKIKNYAAEAAKPPPQAYVLGKGAVAVVPGQVAYDIAPPFAAVHYPGGGDKNAAASKAYVTAYKQINSIPPPNQTQNSGWDWYQGSGSGPINAALGQYSSAKSTAKIREAVKGMDETCLAHTTPYNVIVTRAVGSSHPDYGSMSDLEVGGMWAPEAYQSCSIDSPKNSGVLSGHKVRIHYRIPEGVKGAGFPMNARPGTSIPSECEYVVRRKTRWTCVAKTVSSDGYIDVVVDYAGADDIVPGQWDQPTGNGVYNPASAA